jgi:hypothetical protein
MEKKKASNIKALINDTFCVVFPSACEKNKENYCI